MTHTTITSEVIETTRVLYSHRDGRVVTELTPDNRCAYSGQTLTEICAGESPARQLEVMPLSHQYARRRYCTGPKAITSAQFDEMLNILPPQLWRGRLGTESFMLSEMITGDIGAFFVRIHQDHFRINEERTTSHEKLVSMCYQYMKENDYQE